MKEIFIPQAAQRDRAISTILRTADELHGYRGSTDVLKYARDVDELRTAVKAVAGAPFIGNTSTGFYSFDLPQHQRHTLRHRDNGHDFLGIIKRVVNIHESSFKLPDMRRICLQIAPLAIGVDTGWQEYFIERGWQDQFNHPFAVPDMAGKTAWVAVDSMAGRWPSIPEAVDQAMNGSAPRRV